MKLVLDWQATLRHAWSLRFITAAAVFSLADTFFNFAQPSWLPIPPVVFALLAGVSAAGAFVARLMAQKDLPSK